jgi:hypothetical protein
VHARKPASGASSGAGAESSRSGNTVLKAACYDSELLGIAVLLLRPSPPSQDGGAGSDVQGSATEALDRVGVVEASKQDFGWS